MEVVSYRTQAYLTWFPTRRKFVGPYVYDNLYSERGLNFYYLIMCKEET